MYKTLTKAARAGNLEEVRRLLEAGANVNYADEDDNDPDSDIYSGATALHYAAEQGNVAMAQLLIECGAAVDEYDGSLWTPLFYAVDNGHRDMVALLIGHGADVKKPGQCGGREPEGVASTNLGITPIHMAARGDSAEILALLLVALKQTQTHVDNLKDRLSGKTPLHAAVDGSYGYNESGPKERVGNVKLLLGAGANPTLRCTGGSMFTETAPGITYENAIDMARRNNFTESIQLLEGSIAQNAASSIPMMPSFIHQNLQNRTITDVARLVSALAECKTPSDGNQLPKPELALRRAAHVGKLDLIQVLVATVQDLDINEPGPVSGKTALDLAEERSDVAVSAFLKERGAKTGNILRMNMN